MAVQRCSLRRGRCRTARSRSKRRRRGKADELSGRVRFTAAPGVAVDMLAPFAAVVRRQHPHIQLSLMSSMGHLDLARGQADIALRTREPRDPELYEVASSFVQLAVFAAPSYVRSLPQPCPLDAIDWVGWAPPFEGLAPENWIRAQLPGFQPVFAADSFVAQERAAMCGVGAIVLPEIQARLVGGLERVTLTPKIEKRLPMARIYIVVAKSRWRSPRIKAVAESFVDWLQALPQR